MSLDVDAHQSGHSRDSRNGRGNGEEEAPGTNPADASSHASSCPSDDDSEVGEAADDQLPD
jgi:hypothetical protein